MRRHLNGSTLQPEAKAEFDQLLQLEAAAYALVRTAEQPYDHPQLHRDAWIGRVRDGIDRLKSHLPEPEEWRR